MYVLPRFFFFLYLPLRCAVLCHLDGSRAAGCRPNDNAYASDCVTKAADAVGDNFSLLPTDVREREERAVCFCLLNRVREVDESKTECVSTFHVQMLK